MDTAAALESLAKSLPSLPAEALESMLVTYDTLVSFADPDRRIAAAQYLRDAAGACPDEARRERLLRAAGAVEAGDSCALTPDGQTWQQAAAAQTMSLEEYQARPDLQDDFLAQQLAELYSEDDEPEEEEESEELSRLENAPPELPPLRVGHFFPGLVVRVRQSFQDADGRTVREGQVLHILTAVCSDTGHNLACMERTVRLNSAAPRFDEIAENAGNQWFQPVPTAECLEDLWDLIEDRLSAAEALEEDGGEGWEAIREDVEESQAWLSSEDDRGPVPEYSSAKEVARIFGRDSEMASWLPFLFAGMSALSAS